MLHNQHVRLRKSKASDLSSACLSQPFLFHGPGSWLPWADGWGRDRATVSGAEVRVVAGGKECPVGRREDKLMNSRPSNVPSVFKGQSIPASWGRDAVGLGTYREPGMRSSLDPCVGGQEGMADGMCGFPWPRGREGNRRGVGSQALWRRG